MTKLYKVTMYVTAINEDYSNVHNLIDQIENNRYPEFTHVDNVIVTDIGEWSDDHPLNIEGCDYSKYFKSPEPNNKE